MIHLLQKPLLGVPVNWSHPLARGLVGCYLMNEGSGNKIYDLSGNQNTGTFAAGTAAPVWIPDKFGPALQFDGVNDYTRLSLNPIPSLANPFTFSCWALTTDNTYTFDIYDQRLLNIYIDANNWLNIGNVSSGISDIPIGAVYLSLRIGGVVYSKASSKVTFENNTKVHICVMWNGVSTITFYVNGILFPLSEAAWPNGASDGFTIGARSSSLGFWKGKIDNISFYNRKLTASEIAQLYREPFAMFDRPSIGLLYVPPAGGQTILDYERGVRGVNRGVMVGVS
jgi:hypothetical protein